MKTIFITYNPASSFEQTLAIRLHTIGASSGFKMYLPDRFNSENSLDDETKARINKSDYVVMFSISPLSEIVRREIEYAFSLLKDKSRIIVVYDKQMGKNLVGDITQHFTPIYLEERQQDIILHQILATIQHKEIGRLEKEKSSSKSLAALLGIGLGLLLLNSTSDN